MNNQQPYLGSPENPRTAAIVVYITFLGWLLGYYSLYKNNKNQFTSFHVRQALMLHLLFITVNVLALFVLWFRLPFALIIIPDLLVCILWFIGALDAINNRQKPVPLIGKWAQQAFKNL